MNFTRVTLHTRHLRQQLNFYTKQLGLALLEKTPDFFSVLAGKTILEFKAEKEMQNAPYHFAFNIQPSSLSGVPAFFKQKNINPIIVDDIIIHDFDTWNAKAIYFSDADNNIAELIARYNLYATSPDQDFTSADIHNISEVGLVVNDLPDFTETIRNLTGITTWKNMGLTLKLLVMKTAC